MFSSNASAVSGDVNYIEDVFSTYLYTGNGTSQTITNNINLSTKGGLAWIKDRTVGNGHALFDTLRGPNYRLDTASNNGNDIKASALNSFTTSGFTLGTDGNVNTNTDNYASWTFREQEKFFGVVTYTGTGVARTIAHNLGSVPGCIIVKRTDTAGYDWAVYHRSLTTPSTYKMALNTTAAQAGPNSIYWNSTDPTSTVFSLGTWGDVNASGGSYVAYLFAHDAGGFGLTGTDNVVSCGTYTGDGTTNFSKTITLGYEPQWVMIKDISSGYGSWIMLDTMRGWNMSASDMYLAANSSNAETDLSLSQPNATGFAVGGTTELNSSAVKYIYVAIRRGPMKVPTDGTAVFSPVARTGTGSTVQVSAGFNPDLAIIKARGTTYLSYWFDKLRNPNNTYIAASSTAAEAGIAGNALSTFTQTGVTQGDFANTNDSGSTFINYFLKRAPSFFDEVCWTGAGTSAARPHNLTVVPELMIEKRRSGVANWYAYYTAQDIYSYFNSTNAFSVLNLSPALTSTTFTPVSDTSGQTNVTYLFATCPGVSKVGGYTGTGTTKQIDCGFTAGARFVLIRRTDSTGDWYYWDSARGIVAGNDPYLLFNSTAAEVTSTDYVDTYAAGFELSSTAPAALNASGGTYIFLAIA